MSTGAMSAFGTKRTSLFAPHMSAIGGKADMTIALHMSAFDPKRTSTSSLKVVHFEQTWRPDRLTLSVEPKEIPALIGR